MQTRTAAGRCRRFRGRHHRPDGVFSTFRRRSCTQALARKSQSDRPRISECAENGSSRSICGQTPPPPRLRPVITSQSPFNFLPPSRHHPFRPGPTGGDVGTETAGEFSPPGCCRWPYSRRSGTDRDRGSHAQPGRSPPRSPGGSVPKHPGSVRSPGRPSSHIFPSCGDWRIHIAALFPARRSPPESSGAALSAARWGGLVLEGRFFRTGGRSSNPSPIGRAVSS